MRPPADCLVWQQRASYLPAATDTGVLSHVQDLISSRLIAESTQAAAQIKDPCLLVNPVQRSAFGEHKL